MMKLTKEMDEEIRKIINKNRPFGWSKDAEEVVRSYYKKTTNDGLVRILRIYGHHFSDKALRSKVERMKRKGEFSR